MLFYEQITIFFQFNGPSFLIRIFQHFHYLGLLQEPCQKNSQRIKKMRENLSLYEWYDFNIQT